MAFLRVTKKDEVPPGTIREFQIDGKTFAVSNVDGKLYAINNLCLHRGGPLGQGMIEHGKVVCPWHAWAWDPKTGAAVQDPNMKVAVYPLKIECGEVSIETQPDAI